MHRAPDKTKTDVTSPYTIQHAAIQNYALPASFFSATWTRTTNSYRGTHLIPPALEGGVTSLKSYPTVFSASVSAMKRRYDGTCAWHLAATRRTTATRALYSSHVTAIETATWPQSAKTRLVCIQDLSTARFTETTATST